MENVLKGLGKHCTGCGACSAGCPVSAINMSYDQEGFLKSRIDLDLCINCGICRRVCPVLNPDYSNDDPICHAASAADEEQRMNSFSGGIFPLLAEAVLARGGIVFGAAWQDNFSAAIVSAENHTQLQALRGSKYVQSETRDTFREALEALRSGREVLYSGCPCQIAGLKSFLGMKNDYDANLLHTAEVICHGVPSYEVLAKYLEEGYGIENVEAISFRNKELYGWTASEMIALKNGDVIYSKPGEFMEAFNPCLIMGKACGECYFSRLPRQADITLGDFWGISKFRPGLNDGKGLSIVLINNQRGQELFESVQNLLLVDEVLPLDYATEVNKTILYPFPNHPGRKHFYSSIDLKPFRELAQRALEHHYDVGVVGLWYGLNYGSVLTYYALYEVLRKMGLDPVMLPRPHGLWEGDQFSAPDSLGQRFIWQHCNVLLEYQSLADYIQTNDLCDDFVVGSDVVWNYRICGHDVDQFFFLDWVKSGHRRIAIASSIGEYGKLAGPQEYVAKANHNLSRFDALSLREPSSVPGLAEALNRQDIARVLDPVFLCGRSVFDELCPNHIIGDNGEDLREAHYLFAYLLQPSMQVEKQQAIRHLATKLGLSVKVVGNPNGNYNVGDYTSDALGWIPTVEEWVALIRESSLYFGDSYHGLCFALLYHVPFVIIYGEHQPSFNRIEDLLKRLGLEDRVSRGDYGERVVEAIADKPIDWDSVDRILATEIEESLSWLKTVFSTPVREADTEQHVRDAMLDMGYRQERRIIEQERRIIELEHQLRELGDISAERESSLREEIVGLRQVFEKQQREIKALRSELKKPLVDRVKAKAKKAAHKARGVLGNPFSR